MGRDSFDGSEVIETKECVFFWKPPCVLSQWTPSPFEIDGVRYSCAEQWMMAEKARLFEDAETLRHFMESVDPAKHKALGAKVRGFDEQRWEADRLRIVIQGNLAKFSQNPSMHNELLRTGKKTLVEASPRDRIWGIGLRADDRRIHDRSRWRGLNLLGHALMDVRAKLSG